MFDMNVALIYHVIICVHSLLHLKNVSVESSTSAWRCTRSAVKFAFVHHNLCMESAVYSFQVLFGPLDPVCSLFWNDLSGRSFRLILNHKRKPVLMVSWKNIRTLIKLWMTVTCGHLYQGQNVAKIKSLVSTILPFHPPYRNWAQWFLCVLLPWWLSYEFQVKLTEFSKTPEDFLRKYEELKSKNARNLDPLVYLLSKLCEDKEVIYKPLSYHDWEVKASPHLKLMILPSHGFCDSFYFFLDAPVSAAECQGEVRVSSQHKRDDY